jgi:hypothetical protein
MIRISKELDTNKDNADFVFVTRICLSLFHLPHSIELDVHDVAIECLDERDILLHFRKLPD